GLAIPWSNGRKTKSKRAGPQSRPRRTGHLRPDHGDAASPACGHNRFPPNAAGIALRGPATTARDAGTWEEISMNTQAHNFIAVERWQGKAFLGEWSATGGGVTDVS